MNTGEQIESRQREPPTNRRANKDGINCEVVIKDLDGTSLIQILNLFRTMNHSTKSRVTQLSLKDYFT